jgi:hypothetical protein
MAVGCVIGSELELTSQLLASFTVTEYEPAERPEIIEVEEKAACVDHLYVNGLVPPEPETVKPPFVPPKQETLVVTGEDKDKAAGWVTVIVLLNVQPLASVTVTT